MIGTNKYYIYNYKQRILYLFQAGDHDIVEVLLGLGGVDVNAMDEGGVTALMLASKNGMLLQLGIIVWTYFSLMFFKYLSIRDKPEINFLH